MANKNYNKISNANKQATERVEPKEVISVDSTSAPVNEAPKIRFGVVSGCEKLNVRKRPSLDSDIVCVITKGTEVEINKSGANEFYHVRSISKKDGFNGYCMKEYITVKQ